MNASPKATLATRLILAATMTLAIVTTTLGQEDRLGKVDFPTSGSPQGQALFLRGLAPLHSFWFEAAADDFRKSTENEPGVMLGYSREAISHLYPLWAEQSSTA